MTNGYYPDGEPVTKNYLRPELSEADLQRLRSLMLKIGGKSKNYCLTLLSGALRENAILTKEINEHRAARGFEPLPVHDPK